MKRLSRKLLAHVSLGMAASLNLGITIGDLAQGKVGAAAIQSLALVLLSVVAYVLERGVALLEIQIGHWTAQRDTAVIVHADLVRQKAEFDRRVAETLPAEGRAH